MYVIKRNAEGHAWALRPKSEQPKAVENPYQKLYCVYCGCVAYTVGTDRLSLTGDFYNGDIRQCPGNKDGTKLQRNVLPIEKKPVLVRTKQVAMTRTKSSNAKLTRTK